MDENSPNLVTLVSPKVYYFAQPENPMASFHKNQKKICIVILDNAEKDILPFISYEIFNIKNR
jgi:hypothetical protein